MRKNVIYTELNHKNDGLLFYYRGNHTCHYLFHTKYRQVLYDYFRCGKSITQLRNRKDWLNNTALTKVIEGQLSIYLKEIEKEDVYAG